MMNPNEFEYKRKPVTVTIKQQYKRSNRNKEELIYRILRIIEVNEGITAFSLRTESNLVIGYYQLQGLLKMLTNASLITNDGGSYQIRKVTSYKITDKGRKLLDRFGILFEMLPSVWRGDV